MNETVPNTPQPAQQAMAGRPPRRDTYAGGLMVLRPLERLLELEYGESGEYEQAQPVISALAGQVRRHFSIAKQAKLLVHNNMLEAVYSRRGAYTPEKLAQIAEDDAQPIYMMLFATKARQAKALLADTLIGAGTDKPWTLRPSPKPDLPEEDLAEVMREAAAEVYERTVTGDPMEMEDIRSMLREAKANIEHEVAERAREDAEKAEVEIEDMLVEGGFNEAMAQFLDDITVFKTAFIKGPVLRNVPQLQWAASGHVTVYEGIKPEWERVDPFHIFPAPWAKTVNDGFLIERHRLSRSDLNAMLGVPGYSDAAIREVLATHGTGGLRNWADLDVSQASAEGSQAIQYQDDLIDALQYWGSVSGDMLREWGMSEEDIPDVSKEYHVEVWLIGQWVIKAVRNSDPLGRRPYFGTSYSPVAGAFWGASLYDVIADCQNLCNAAARALTRNLGISSGPQVVVNLDAVPPGEDVTNMYPWKVWQVRTDPANPNAHSTPVSFFQPGSNASELMGVYEKFSVLADEYSGIPRYMAGVEGGSIGRTASGLSMMVGNASKTIKELVGNIDRNVTAPAVKRAYEWTLMYAPHKQLRGDVNIVARGALSLMVKETAQVRRNEFLRATANSIDMQIIGVKGRAALLRESAKSLDMDVDDIVPDEAVMKAQENQARLQMLAQAQARQGAAAAPDAQGGEMLMDGAPVSDQFQPVPEG